MATGIEAVIKWRELLTLKDDAKNVDELITATEPNLPARLAHNITAFLEDEGHDWKWANGLLRYFGRGGYQNAWLVLEYE